MLRVASLSLVLGALGLIAGLKFFLLPAGNSVQAPTPILWDAASASARAEHSAVEGRQLRLQIDRRGIATVVLPATFFAAGDYPFLHLSLQQSHPDTNAVIIWKTAETGEQRHYYKLENRSRQSLWLAASELTGWEGTISSVGLLLVNAADQQVNIEDFSIYPTGLSYQLRAIYTDWAGYVPWNRAAMNSYTGVTRASSFYPVPLTVAFFFASLCGYGVLLLLFRSRLRFNWRVIALLFITCWIALDLAWQNRLWHHAADSYRLFAGKETQEKLQVGPDAKLYGFISRIKEHLEDDGSRIFVSTTDKYIGLRSTYYLYPYNTMFAIHGPELPDASLMRSGDYIVLTEPTQNRFFAAKGLLRIPNQITLKVEGILTDASGSLMRVK